ncbi:hypothetical protein Bca4012_065599 [Brassica carinata]
MESNNTISITLHFWSIVLHIKETLLKSRYHLRIYGFETRKTQQLLPLNAFSGSLYLHPLLAFAVLQTSG